MAPRNGSSCCGARNPRGRRASRRCYSVEYLRRTSSLLRSPEGGFRIRLGRRFKSKNEPYVTLVFPNTKTLWYNRHKQHTNAIAKRHSPMNRILPGTLLIAAWPFWPCTNPDALVHGMKRGRETAPGLNGGIVPGA